MVCLFFVSCGGNPPPYSTSGAIPPVSLKKRILALSISEWIYFGRQIVVFKDHEESIPHVGLWEDDDSRAFRINQYWRAVDRADLTGYDCQQPWSAAFVSWVMHTSGVPEEQFQAADAHWIYLNHWLRQAKDHKGSFIPRTLKEYPPRPGDLICANRDSTEWVFNPDTPYQELPEHIKLHCDIVVNRKGHTLEAIGGNVRNSVSKIILKLDKNGLLQPSSKRHWFMVVENRLE
jgi:hypothetical protein